MRIAADLEKHYSGVTEVTKLHRNKLRVALDNAKEANGIVCDPKFCVEYRVWIPARSVEIDGVVSEDHLTVQQVLKGVGLFKRKNLPTVQVIEVRQMGNSDGEGENKKFVPTNSYRVTFAGTALPDYLEIGNVLRLPVRLYYPKVMSCSNCQKLGHTKAFCNNKTICGKCGENHQTDQCKAVPTKCLICGGAVHETRCCPKYQERSDKLKQEISKRSKRSFAEIVKTSKVENHYAVLAEEDPQSEEEATEEELVYSTLGGGPKRKRKIKKKSGKTQSAKTGNPPTETRLPQPGAAAFNRMFPSVSTTKPGPAVSRQNGQPEDHRIPFSKILEMVLTVLSEPTRLLLEPLIPFFKEVAKNLAVNSALSTVILFDV
ncbi:uncharacterized protein LOC120426623 [Culex pipiens pallens]|uniref:uncharacterized protein LOC120426623 n=1 Tax=Culex pipiens pallens TaxID=42434 RepID=UPI001954C632|nr:uncharacterized protein LOC120426623 [Culex pipiens pallens]